MKPQQMHLTMPCCYSARENGVDMRRAVKEGGAYDIGMKTSCSVETVVKNLLQGEPRQQQYIQLYCNGYISIMECIS